MDRRRSVYDLEMEDEKDEWFRRYQTSGSDTTWRTLRSAHSNGSDLDMNSGWRTGWIEGSHEGCGKAFDIPDSKWFLISLTRPPSEGSLVVAWYDSQDQRFEEVFTWIWLTKKLRTSSKRRTKSLTQTLDKIDFWFIKMKEFHTYRVL